MSWYYQELQKVEPVGEGPEGQGLWAGKNRVLRSMASKLTAGDILLFFLIYVQF